MERIRKYNEVLGLKTSVNAGELKKLYRNRAKNLHPDRNSSPASHEEFVLLTEAYHYYRKALTQLENDLKVASPFNHKKYPGRYAKETWKVDERMAARKRAAEKKKMRYDHFAQLGYYKRLDQIFYAFDVIRFVFALVLIFILPVFLFLQEGIMGLIIVFFVQIVTYRLWARALNRFLHFSAKLGPDPAPHRHL